MRALYTLPILLAASTSFALPRPNSTVRAGANHHIGDDSYIAKYGHNVDRHASERDRMHQHLQFVHDWLAARPPTKPELATRRNEILAHFADYIAKNTTPKNERVPWRTPVFIDDEGTICAVGYLIQETTNKELPKKIAKSHRYDFIEDIAGDMPEVSSWVAESGFTLDEIAHIQPAYEEPGVNTWRTWEKITAKTNGAYDKLNSRGTFVNGKMVGHWEVYDDKNNVVGHGEMKHGNGVWTSTYDDGATFATGKYVNNVAEGKWQMFHASGNLAAEGRFSGGTRTGLWHFYYDTPDDHPMATGRFGGRGKVVGKWKHFDEAGDLLATSWTETPSQWHDTDWAVDGGEGFVLDITAKPGEIKHASHRGTVNSAPQSLDMFALDGERIYVHHGYGEEVMYDDRGDELIHSEGKWTEQDCHWNAKRKEYAQRGDLVPLHGALYTDSRQRAHITHEGVGGPDGSDAGPVCGPASTIAATRTKKLDALLAAREQVRALTPQFVRAQVLHEEVPDEDLSDEDKTRVAAASDMTQVLEQNMSMYIEWPHIDGRFRDLFEKIPGRKTVSWAGGDSETED
jgi:hypothetical protein